MFGKLNSTSIENIFLGGANGIPGSGAIIFMFRWFVAQLIQHYQWTGHYTRFIITRPDQYYFCPHDLQGLDPQFLWIPSSQDYGGFCDRHVVTNADHVLAVLNLLEPLVQDPSKYHDRFLLRL